MRADFNSNSASFGMAFKRPSNMKAFGKYFNVDLLRFRRGVSQIIKEQGANQTFHLRYNDADNSVDIIREAGKVICDGQSKPLTEVVEHFPQQKESVLSERMKPFKEGKNTGSLFANIKLLVGSFKDMLLNPKKMVRRNLYDAAEKATALEKRHNAALAKAARQEEIAGKLFDKAE